MISDRAIRIANQNVLENKTMNLGYKTSQQNPICTWEKKEKPLIKDFYGNSH